MRLYSIFRKNWRVSITNDLPFLSFVVVLLALAMNVALSYSGKEWKVTLKWNLKGASWKMFMGMVLSMVGVGMHGRIA